MKRPERELAKEKPAEFNTAYPTQKEIEWYLEQGLIDELDNRLNDKTIRNRLLDAAKAEAGITDYRKLPYEIFRKIYVNVDIRVILDEATKSSKFQRLLYDEEFWKQKFETDFPELVLIHGMNLPTEAKNNYLINTYDPRKFQENPWRRYYNVMRYMIKRLRKELPSFLGIITKKNIELKFMFNSLSSFERTITEIKTGKIIETKILSFSEFLNHYEMTNINYLKKISLRPISDSMLQELVKWIKDKNEVYPQFLKGYYKKDQYKPNKIVIGCSICKTPTKFMCSLTKVPYCSVECQGSL